MMEYAHEGQANLHLDKAYEPPPTPAESLDHSLAYRGPRREGRPLDHSGGESRSRSSVLLNCNHVLHLGNAETTVEKELKGLRQTIP
jgi:hypothetical protein